MKKLLFLSVAAAMFGFSACKKINGNSDGTSPVYTPPVGTGPAPVTNPLGDMPQEFTKKAVIEEATAVWCGYCPNGAYAMNQAVTANPDKVYGVAFHKTDVMADLYDGFTAQASSELSADYAISGIPGGIVNRDASTNNYNSWGATASAEIAKVAQGGLGIITEKVSADQYTVEVHAGFNTTLSGDYRIVLYVLEDEVHKGSAYEQHNYMDADAGSPWEGKGDPMSAANFMHQHVLRQAITKGLYGDAIDASKLKPGGEFVQKFTVDISSEWDVANTYVIAMIVKKGADAASNGFVNAQECKLGSIKKWD